jgi:hypothetical protein
MKNKSYPSKITRFFYFKKGREGNLENCALFEFPSSVWKDLETTMNGEAKTSPCEHLVCILEILSPLKEIKFLREMADSRSEA